MNIEFELDEDEAFAYERILDVLGEQNGEEVDPDEQAKAVLCTYIGQEFPKIFNG